MPTKKGGHCGNMLLYFPSDSEILGKVVFFQPKYLTKRVIACILTLWNNLGINIYYGT